MKIFFTKHAIDKLKTNESRKFHINKKRIESVIREPISKKQLKSGVFRTVGSLDRRHSLCVIYKYQDDIIKVITFFAAEKGRYENRIL